MPTGAKTLLMQKSGGKFELAIWAEPVNWNESTHSQVTVPAANVTVSLGATYQTFSLYDPTQSASPLRTFNGASSVQVQVTDHPLIVEISPTTIPGGGGTTTPSSPTFIIGPTFGSGNDTLRLYLSEDAYLGDAQAWITIDGHSVSASLQPVTALRGTGQQEVFVVRPEPCRGRRDHAPVLPQHGIRADHVRSTEGPSGH